MTYFLTLSFRVATCRVTGISFSSPANATRRVPTSMGNNQAIISRGNDIAVLSPRRYAFHRLPVCLTPLWG